MYDPEKAHYIVATGIIVKDGKFLLIKRSDEEKNFPGKWTVPGGKLEKSDYNKRKPDTSTGQWYNIFAGLVRREVKEETGLEVKNVKYLTDLIFERTDGVPTLVVSLFADYNGGKVKLGKDFTEFVWVSLEEAKSYDLIDGIYEELDMLDKHLRGQEIGEWKGIS